MEPDDRDIMEIENVKGEVVVTIVASPEVGTKVLPIGDEEPWDHVSLDFQLANGIVTFIIALEAEEALWLAELLTRNADAVLRKREKNGA